ncbi:MAG: rhomboid family intramembrane serine protease [Erysipelotrichaceae bacterium]|nr:rhomboid family intramembrane serine protease [Erysipelotrichaceae bacterium]
MNYTNYDVYTLQLLHFFVVKCGYSIATIQPQKEDIWLINSKNETYPVIRLAMNLGNEKHFDINYARVVHRGILDAIQREGKLCILTTSMDSMAIDNDFFVQIVITPGYISDPTFIHEFPGVDSVVHDVENNQEECALLTSLVEKKQLKIKKNKVLPPMIKMPKVTMSIIFLCLFAYIGSFALRSYLQSDVLGLIVSGAYYKMQIVAAHEYWRFLASGFLHIDLFHLLMNMYALFQIGLLCEKSYKRRHYIFILLASIIVGNIFTYIIEGNVLSVGMSGGIYGVMAAFVVCLFENGHIKYPLIRKSIVRLIILNILITLLPGVSFSAHLGGMLTGIFLGIIFISSIRWKQLKQYTLAAFSILVIGLFFLSSSVQRVEPIQKNVDTQIVNTYRSLGMERYATYLERQYHKTYGGE